MLLFSCLYPLTVKARCPRYTSQLSVNSKLVGLVVVRY